MPQRNVILRAVIEGEVENETHNRYSTWHHRTGVSGTCSFVHRRQTTPPQSKSGRKEVPHTSKKTEEIR